MTKVRSRCPHLKLNPMPPVANKNKYYGPVEKKPAERLRQSKVACALTNVQRKSLAHQCPKYGTRKEGSARRPTSICWCIDRFDKIPIIETSKTKDKEEELHEDENMEEVNDTGPNE